MAEENVPWSRLPAASARGYLLLLFSGVQRLRPASPSTLFCPLKLSRSRLFRLAILLPCDPWKKKESSMFLYENALLKPQVNLGTAVPRIVRSPASILPSLLMSTYLRSPARALDAWLGDEGSC